jgi:hypothetical protein
MICFCTAPGCLCALFYVPEDHALLELLGAHPYQQNDHPGTPQQNLVFTLSDIKYSA